MSCKPIVSLAFGCIAQVTENCSKRVILRRPLQQGALGDDHPANTGGMTVARDQYLHGSAQERSDAFRKSFAGGTLASCETKYEERRNG
jgi:predicted metalloprotease